MRCPSIVLLEHSCSTATGKVCCVSMQRIAWMSNG